MKIVVGNFHIIQCYIYTYVSLEAYVKSGTQGRGGGKAIWFAIEKL